MQNKRRNKGNISFILFADDKTYLQQSTNKNVRSKKLMDVK